MSFAEARIEEYLTSKSCTDQPRTAVPFGETKMGDLEIVIVAKDRLPAEGHNVSEEEIERRLAEESVIRLPPDDQQPLGEFKRIDVGGKPMSEMIIEERR